VSANIFFLDESQLNRFCFGEKNWETIAKNRNKRTKVVVVTVENVA
jgi:hypothetical protein